MSEKPSETTPGLPAGGLPEIPRPVTAKVRRRAWNEPQTRFWWVAALAILIAGLFMAVSRTMDWWEESSLLRSGVVVQAMAYDGNGSRIKNRPIQPEMEVVVEYEYQGKLYKQRGKLSTQTFPIMTAIPFDVHINPGNPDLWTDLMEAPPLYGKLIGFFLLVIMGGICGVLAFWKYRGFVWLWTVGEAGLYVITEIHHVAGAPRSVQLRCAHGSLRHEQIATVYLPIGKELPEVGQPLQLIILDHGSRALAVANYQ